MIFAIFPMNFSIMKINSYKFILLFTALVWLLNGIYAKLLNGVPRHKEIIEEILQINNSNLFIITIGTLEILMAIWILSGKYSRTNAVVQSVIILLMNTLEITFVPELLLWGKWNFIFACLFVILILWNEFYNKPKTTRC